MRRWTKLKLARPTVASDLTLSLVIVMIIVFGLASSVNYLYSLRRDTSALYEKAEEIVDNLASVLVKPLWNIDTNELKKIISVYRQSGIVLDIRLVDEVNREIVSASKDMALAFLSLNRVIRYENTPIGRVTVAFSDANIVAKQREFALYAAILFTSLTLTLVLATTLLVRRFLNDPFTKLKGGLELISSGDYTHQFERLRQQDLNDITEKVMGMAREIAKRQDALENNRQKLAILNTAILDIFSCSYTIGLMRKTLDLTNKLCGVDYGWFLGKRVPSQVDTDGPQNVPKPQICIRGHIFEAKEDEVAPYIHQPSSDKVFNFPLRSRRREVGEITLAFDQTPDPSTTSLLKSLMSLVNPALIRQSFIREEAINIAELQVAATVQRSMLPDEARTPYYAIVAHHYEPVHRVGGDWFSVIESRDRKEIYALLGDVTGHGLAQGLVTTAVAGALQVLESLIQDFGSTSLVRPSQIITQLNNVISRIAGKSNLRMTCVAVKLDLENNRLSVCNAGHTFPVLIRRHNTESKAETLSRNQQYMLGEDVIRDQGFVFQDAEYELGANDILMLYTDGLTDALDKDGRAFTRKFYRFFSRLNHVGTPEQLKDDLMRLLRAHTSDIPVKDDICVLAISRKPRRDASVA